MATFVLISHFLSLFSSLNSRNTSALLSVARSLCLLSRDRIERDDRMRISTPGTHLGSNPYCFHDFFGSRLVSHRSAGVAADAIRTLCHGATATAINCFVFEESAPSANTL